MTETVHFVFSPKRIIIEGPEMKFKRVYIFGFLRCVVSYPFLKSRMRVLLLFVKTKAATIVLFPNDNTLLELHIQMNEVKPVLDWLKQ